MKFVLFITLLAFIIVTSFALYTFNSAHVTKAYTIEVCRDKVMGNYEKKWDDICFKDKLNSNCKLPSNQLSQVPTWNEYVQQMRNCSE